MKAVLLPEFGGVEQLIYTTVATPEPNENEVLIKIHSIGVNPVDAKARQGKAFAAKLKNVVFPVILGKDFAGEIVKTGENVTNFTVGDVVFGIANAAAGFAKTYAEYVATPVDCIARVPNGVSMSQAAASPVAALTAMQALEEAVTVTEGTTVLIHAGAGGVGHFAIQYAKHLGAHVTATSSAANKDFILTTLGADAHIDYKTADFNTYANAFDVVIDLVGLHNIDTAILTTKPGGDVVCVPSNSFEVFKQKVSLHAVKGHTLLMHADTAWVQRLAKVLGAGILTPYVSAVYGLEQVQEVHKQVETGKTKGKIVMHV